MKIGLRVAIFLALAALGAIPYVRANVLDPLNNATAWMAARQLSWAGWTASAHANRMEVNGQVVTVYQECSGAFLVFLFVLGVLLLPRGGWGRWTAFTVGGSVLLYTLNTTRVAILAALVGRHQASFEWWHYYGFPAIIIALIVTLWVLLIWPTLRPR